MEQYRGWLWWWGDAAGAHPIYTLAIICPLVTPTHQTPFNVTIARIRHCYCPLSDDNFNWIFLLQFDNLIKNLIITKMVKLMMVLGHTIYFVKWRHIGDDDSIKERKF